MDPIARAAHGADFADCTPARQTELVARLDEDLDRRRRDPDIDETRTFFYDVKRFTLAGYFTSEVGLRSLGYRIIPGAFEGCVLLDQYGTGEPRPGERNGSRERAVSRRQETWDAIVVGSGITGGWAAKELTELGLRVLVLEAGPMIVPERDYVEHVPPYRMPYRGWNDRKALAAEQPVQRECYACDEMGRKFFVNDIENPYTTDEDKPFLWIRGRQVGGRSIMWARQSYRLSDLDFEANARDGIGVDWPIRYSDLAPWYAYVEDFVGISGQPEGLPQLPDGVLLPPMQMTCVENAVKEAIARDFGDTRMMTIGRTAVLTRDHKGRSACHYCGPLPPRLPDEELLQFSQRHPPRGRGYRTDDAAPG